MWRNWPSCASPTPKSSNTPNNCRRSSITPKRCSEVDTSHVPPTPYVLPLTNVMRDDEPAPSLTNDQALANAPDRDDGFFRVRAVFEE